METLADYDFHLPNELIATEPLLDRSTSRLLCQKIGEQNPIHDSFSNILNYLKPGDTLVVNNTKVMKARIYAFKATGSKVEILLVRALGNNTWTALMNGKGPFLPGTKLSLAQGDIIEVLAKVEYEPGAFLLTSKTNLLDHAKRFGELPLPPYFRRKANEQDHNSYQTIFAHDENLGAVAAPTAGLHFSEDLIAELIKKQIQIAQVTLHVGPGTFLPIRVENIAEHKMHAEYFSMSKNCADMLNQARVNNNRIIVVGTTAMRVVEQVKQWAYEKNHKEFFSCSGKTSIFIRPGYKFLGSNALITNFHVPRSTLLLLVSAILGREKTLKIYQEAIDRKYRFFSYGDACYFEIGPQDNE